MNSLPIIAGVEITTDAEGRFNLNALHRASGGAEHKRPSKWLSSEPTQALIRELESQSPQKGFGAISTVRGGNAPGTFAAEQLAVAYANWISPAFYLKVIQIFLDYKNGKLISPVPMLEKVPKTFSEALRLAADLVEENAQQRAELEITTPKARALDRMTEAEGCQTMTETAKALHIKPYDLRDWLLARKWLYRNGAGKLLPYQDKLASGFLDSSQTIETGRNGATYLQSRWWITSKGVQRIAFLLAKESLV